MPKVSVIVPVYNAEAYLAKCIDSILAQDFGDFELILVEDGSTDASAAICSRYAGRYPAKIKVVRTEGKGLSDARNTGVRNACGEYVTFVDSDDLLFAGALTHLTDMAARYDSPVAVGQMSRTIVKSIPQDNHIGVFDADEAIASALYQEPMHHNSACAKLFRKELVADIFASGKYYEDLEAFAGIYLAAGRIAVSDRPVYYYRPNPTSFINTWHEKRHDALWAVDSIRHELADRALPLRKAALARSFSAYYNIFNLASANNRPDIADRCYRFIREHRAAILADRRVRLKNKAGALLSFFGPSVMAAVAKRLNH